jgi:Ca2+-binding EF-hand superfamily protein
MFELFDADRDGRIDADELGRALAHYEYAGSLTFQFSPLSLTVLPSASKWAHLSSICW